MIKIEKKEECCGCGACKSVCNHNAISFEIDNEGFWYPHVNLDKCVDCKLCESVCPFIGKNKSKLKQSKVYAAKCLNIEQQKNSSSGGVFPCIAQYILEIGGVVFGTVYDGPIVKHSYIDKLEDLYKICGSKYVQSDNFSSFKNVRSFLKAGKTVLYSGTPCQCLALRKYLKKEYERLYIVDIVCHGVPSPLVWNHYLNDVSRKNNDDIKNISFIKFKYKDGKKYLWSHPGFIIKWKNGTCFETYSNVTGYENGYLSNLFVRPSCHTCKVKKISSESDMTIGDFWGCERIIPEFNDPNGVSVVFTNTEKGILLLSLINKKLKLAKVSIAEATKYNFRIKQSSCPHPNRIRFFHALNKSNASIDEIVEENINLNLFQKIVFKLQNVIKSVFYN